LSPPHWDAIVVGAGPAGSAVARLLASWGHSVCIVNKPSDHSRGLGESLPPSTRKLLEAIDVLEDVDRAGFYRTSGNTVWWASRERRVERFDPSGQLRGYQVFRPAFDRVLLDRAAAAGAEVRQGTVRRVEIEGRSTPIVELEDGTSRESIACRFAIDCSGRAGVIARPYRRFEPLHRLYALVGVWTGPARGLETPPPAAENLVDPTHTVVETYDDGWAWSVPIADTTRHVGTMVDGTSTRVTGGRPLTDAYRAEIGKTTEVARMLDGAMLQRVFACDASIYSSTTYAGPGFLLVGDAGSFIDPLSSFGVKKALASAWIGAVVVHTSLTHPDRADVSLEFFTQWERDVHATHLERSREFAREAHAYHSHPFWAARALIDVPDRRPDAASLLREREVQAAFESIRQRAEVEFAPAEDVSFVQQAVIRGREIVLESAIPLTGSRPASVRFLNNVDLVALAELSRDHARIPDLFEAYCRREAPAPLPDVLAGLSFLLARRFLTFKIPSSG
jgi:flavin-dependent dehydrogenase